MEQKFCQSCGMPMANEILGTNADGSRNEDYCIYCYKDSKFTQDMTMEQMIDHCAQFTDEINRQSGQNLTQEQAKEMMRQFFPHLKRWKNSFMSNKILYILLPDYAAHEVVYLSQAIASDEYALKENPRYVNKAVAPTLEPVKSIGGFRTLPDYSFDTMPDDYAALVLIGGFGWTTPIAEQVVPIIRKAIEKGKIVGAICNGASFMAKCGLLNKVKHTGNGLDQLKLWGGDNYTNPDGYIHAQAVSDGNIVTANGSATLEFAKELLSLLENDTPERIEMYYQFNKQGFCALFPG
ncbi:hypothetical protein EEL51_13830 [Muribaculaceae bacterium Isolate-110 (HZI)]|nr:hypothetical protein EEL51_13830 [Muribaculaceae bacterium Isolate-110 (HZI)]